MTTPTAVTYFGDKVVSDVDYEENGNVRLTLELTDPVENEDGSRDVAEKISIPAWEYEACKTEEPSDLTELRNTRAVYIVDKLYGELKSLDISVSDMNFIIDKLLQKVKGTEFQAIWNCLGVTNSEEIRLSHYEEKL